MAFEVTDEMVEKADVAAHTMHRSLTFVRMDVKARRRAVMRSAIEAIAPMIHNNALEVLAARAEEMINGEDTNTSDRQALLRAFHRQDMAYEIAEAARAMKTTQSA